MPDKPWKVMERRVARKLGGQRNPLSGGSSRHTRGDVIHPELFVECKHGVSLPHLKLMHQVEEKAEDEGKLAILALHVKGEKHDYFLVRDDHIQVLAKSASR